jgi:DNA-directed RNA polymerase specialized sigma24 family protein
MGDPQAGRILERLQSARAPEAWQEFLETYSRTILRVIRVFETDPDKTSDAFLFVCEQLSRRGFRRLRQFRLEGPATFRTWLQAVTRNLCLDWHRRQHGRHRPFRSISRLPRLEREVFEWHYRKGLSVEETFLTLKPRFSGLTEEQVDEAFERLRNTLTTRQRRLLRSRKPGLQLWDRDDPGNRPARRLPNPHPDPEVAAAAQEEREALQSALRQLPGEDRLLGRNVMPFLQRNSGSGLRLRMRMARVSFIT